MMKKSTINTITTIYMKIFKNYMKPTPKKLRRWGDSILAMGTALTTYSLLMQWQWIAIGSAVLTCLGKFITNFWKEENI